ncbi:hypothetical protein CVT24_012585, partial [Panaeolus cyanescens]
DLPTAPETQEIHAGIVDDGDGGEVVSDTKGEGIGNTLRDTQAERERDADSEAYGKQQLAGADPIQWDKTVRSRVLKDPFHVSRASWVWKHCRRIIPPPEVLFPLVKKLFYTYGPLKDAATNQPLFNYSNRKIARQIRPHSQRIPFDPPNESLYTVLCLDARAANLPVYRCSRGTNSTEGGVHTHLRPHLPTSGVSMPQSVTSCFNTTQRRHFSIWITNRLQERLIYLRDYFENPVEIKGWVNGNLYLPTKEQFNPDSKIQGNQSHSYLAKMQGTRKGRKAILPVHTPAEMSLFKDLMEKEPGKLSALTSTCELSWSAAVTTRNERADTENDIYYKISQPSVNQGFNLPSSSSLTISAFPTSSASPGASESRAPGFQSPLVPADSSASNHPQRASNTVLDTSGTFVLFSPEQTNEALFYLRLMK